VLVAVIALALWQLLATVPVFGRVWLPPFFFSNPVDVISQIIDWFSSGVIWKHLLITLWESVLAFVIGSVSGVAVGFWFARQPLVAAVFDPYVKISAFGRRSHSASRWCSSSSSSMSIRASRRSARQSSTMAACSA